MSVSADTLRELGGLGLSIDQIASVVEIMERSDETRRAKAREKKRSQRLLRARPVPGTGGDNSGQYGTGGDSGGQPSPKERSPLHPPKEITPSTSLRSEILSLAREQELDAEFEQQFWPAYPHKVGRPEALGAFRRARIGQAARGKPPRSPVAFDRIMSGLDRYLQSKPPDRAWLNPATFLNAEHYDDEPASTQVRSGHARPANDALLDAIVREFAPPSGPGQRAPVANGRDDDHGEGPAGASGKHIDLEGAAYRRTS